MESAISKVEYEKLLAEIKQRIRSAQTRAALAVNRELVLLYWQIGREIVERQSREGWGAKVIERLAADLGREFPEVEGFGARNLRNMRDLAREWPDGEIVQQLVAKLPWGHNMQILRLPSGPEREWYARAAVEYGWSRAVLVHQIETKLYQRQGKSNTSPNTRRSYSLTLDELFAFSAGRALTRSLLQEWKASIEALAPSTINVKLSAVRSLVGEARRNCNLACKACVLGGLPATRQLRISKQNRACRNSLSQAED